MHRVFARLATVGRAVAGRCEPPNRLFLAAAGPARALLRPSSEKPPPMAAALFLDNENYNAHSVMMNDPAYGETVVNTDAPEQRPVVTDQQFHALITQDFGSRTADGTCDDFLKISAYAMGREFDLTDAAFDALRAGLTAALPRFTDHQLMSALRAIPLWGVQNGKDPVYYQLWSELDKQCVQRYAKWSLNKMLLFMDCWYLMRLSKMSNFVWLGVRKLARKPSRYLYSCIQYLIFVGFVLHVIYVLKLFFFQVDPQATSADYVLCQYEQKIFTNVTDVRYRRRNKFVLRRF